MTFPLEAQALIVIPLIAIALAFIVARIGHARKRAATIARFSSLGLAHEAYERNGVHFFGNRGGHRVDLYIRSTRRHYPHTSYSGHMMQFSVATTVDTRFSVRQSNAISDAIDARSATPLVAVPFQEHLTATATDAAWAASLLTNEEAKKSILSLVARDPGYGTPGVILNDSTWTFSQRVKLAAVDAESIFDSLISLAAISESFLRKKGDAGAGGPARHHAEPGP